MQCTKQQLKMVVQLCFLQVIMPQVLWHHFRNIIVGPGDTLFQVLQWQNMCFIIKNDKGFEVRSQAGKSVNIILCKACFINPVLTLYHPKWNLFQLEWSIDKYSIDFKVNSLAELVAYDKMNQSVIPARVSWSTICTFQIINGQGSFL